MSATQILEDAKVRAFGLTVALTPTQANTLTFIRNFSAGNGYPPTRAEISRNFGWASSNAAQEHLNALVRKGAIRIAKGLARGITVVGGAA